MKDLPSTLYAAVTVILKDRTVIIDELFQVDVIEQFLVLVEHPNPINFDACASVVDTSGNDLLLQWKWFG